MTSLAVNLSIDDSTWLPTLFAVNENTEQTFNLNHTYASFWVSSHGCIIIYSFTCGIKNLKGTWDPDYVARVPHPYEPDSFLEYDCHISYAFLPFVVGNFLCPEVPHHKIWI